MNFEASRRRRARKLLEGHSARWLLAAMLGGCGHYAGAVVSPNGTVFTLANAGAGGPISTGFYACRFDGRAIDCVRVPTP